MQLYQLKKPCRFTLESNFNLLSRLSSESLTALEIPNDMLQIIQDLILDLRVRCIIVTLQHTAEGNHRRLQVSLLIVFCLGLGLTVFQS